ncbi:hypothetical protein HDU77_005194 [Chytriomyces hyalinus]|uniref:GST C-terminal domain-containing protein n=1 Tax=Chytriomyces confervae TaxID=246404 RepID=A0A507ELY7_9FUNG|nr:hypothetical protein HDU77_005194 [Chytriomyces hyalinus]TPX64250.1 hypothetical protein CcCBS67573_g08455 [Chytriomyces confervae]
MSSATLYYTTTSCGASNFIAAHRAGILGSKLDAQQADIRAHKILTGPKAGSDFYAVNPKGNVPTIVLADGTVLNENAATLQWIADNAVTPVGAKNGTSERYLLQSKLSWISSELHGTVGGLFNPTISAEVREYITAKSYDKLKFLNDVELADGRKYFVGSGFTVADSYLYIVLSWSPYIKLDLSKYPKVEAYFKNIAELPFVKEAHAAMAKASPPA